MTLPPRLRAALVLAAALGIMTSEGCRMRMDGRDEVRRLHARVDSLAVTVAGLVALSGTGASARESLTMPLVEGAPTTGAADAPVTMIEFTDYQCPYCRKHALEVWPSINRTFIERGKVRYVVKDLPLVEIHPDARELARAARCAALVSPAKYWPFRDSLFSDPGGMHLDSVHHLARTLGIEVGAFAACLRSEHPGLAVDADRALAGQLGVSGTPTFVVGRTPEVGGSLTGTVVRGAASLEELSALIESTSN